MRILCLVLILINCNPEAVLDMGSQRIDYNHTKTWTITLNNAIGPTATLRTLDNASPNDTNSIWLAPNGSDAAAGTEAAPVLTLEKAIDLLQAGTPTVTTIHIFRNSFVGAIGFTLSDDHTASSIPACILQVELGETATVTMDIVSDEPVLFTSTAKLNGIYFIDNTDRALITDYVFSFSGVSTVKWCSFASNSDSDKRIYLFSDSTLTVSNCIANGANSTDGTFVTISVSSTSVVNDCIIYNFVSLRGAVGMLALTNHSITVDHCTFYNNQVALENSGSGSTLDVTNSIFNKNGTNWAVVAAVTESFTYCLFDSQTGITLDTTNQIGVIPAFFDQLADDFRLMDKRRTAPNSTDNFNFTSLAVYNLSIGQTPGDDTRDLGPYDVSYAADLDEWLTFEMDDEFWNSDVNFTYELVNSHTYTDVRGNFRRSFDGNRRSVNLQMDSKNFTGNVDSYKIKDIIMSEGSKRYYPQGDSGVWNSSGALVENADGDFDVTLSAISDLTRNAYEGFVATAASGALEFELRIKSNASGSLVLEDHRGNQAGVVDDTYNFICSYLPVEVDQQSTPQVFSDWSASLNPLRETSASEYEQQEGHVRSLRLKETEEDE